MQDITLKGRSFNSSSLIRVNGGTLVLKSGGTISGNTNTSSVYSYGGGVYVYVNMNNGGAFTKAPRTGGTSGIIYGSDASGTLKNTAADGGAAVCYSSRPVRRQKNTTAGETVSLSTASSANWD